MSASLNKIVDVNVEVSNPVTISSDFNLCCIVAAATNEGKRGNIIEYTADSYATQMVSDGFLSTSNEYKKVTAYFAQTPKSDRVLVAVMNDAENNDAAFTRIRGANDEFYGICYAEKLDASDVAAVAALVEASGTPTVFFYVTDDVKCTQTNQDNVMSKLKSLSYTRTVGFYSNDLMADGAALGLFAGLNSLDVNSAYTFAYKTLAGITPENLSDVQLSALVGYNGNTYAKFGNQYKFTYPGITSNGNHIDAIFFVDAAAFLIQQNVVAGLVSSRRIPQTNEGVSNLISFAAAGCDTLVSAGFLSSGVWRGDAVLSLNTGDAVEAGYYIEAENIYDQSAADRASRVSPPIYVALLFAGAIEHVVIRVFVNQ